MPLPEACDQLGTTTPKSSDYIYLHPVRLLYWNLGYLIICAAQIILKDMGKINMYLITITHNNTSTMCKCLVFIVYDKVCRARIHCSVYDYFDQFKSSAWFTICTYFVDLFILHLSNNHSNSCFKQSHVHADGCMHIFNQFLVIIGMHLFSYETLWKPNIEGTSQKYAWDYVIINTE